ncbi:MAG: hypothetical protein QOH67_1292, partial [Hyphomicrobiales bacterium]|nr:hypothetical protein [Hyphomicrobiales bacterium]
DAAKIRSLYVTLDEARFYFPTDICNILGDLHSRSELFLAHLGMARIRNIDVDEDEERTRNAETLASDQSMLRAIYASLPVDFAPALAFKQLTSH